MQITALPSASPLSWPPSSSSPWKEALLVSAIALSSIAALAQLFVGSLSASLMYSFLGGALYTGYTAQKKLSQSYREKQYLNALHKSAETLREECQSFRLENKTMSQNNHVLSEQVLVLKNRLQEMEALLAKIDTSASMTQELLRSCIDVSQDQKKTEKNILDLLAKLEKSALTGRQKETEERIVHLAETLQSMEKQIKQFFLHDTKASELLEVKKQFQATSQELERVQKELAETSARLDKTSLEIESKLSRLSQQEKQLGLIKKLTPLVLDFLRKPEIQKNLSHKDLEHRSSLENNWKLLEGHF